MSRNNWNCIMTMRKKAKRNMNNWKNMMSMRRWMKRTSTATKRGQRTYRSNTVLIAVIPMVKNIMRKIILKIEVKNSMMNSIMNE